MLQQHTGCARRKHTDSGSYAQNMGHAITIQRLPIKRASDFAYITCPA